ncbi:transglycosylase domain-containing protein [Microbacterium invictum]|uniref:Membrane peptidoglycan carboxypeptidase n=1 Tax=Microbacterium invictum TaxID=515415 RepID=A0AA40SLI7_9MICO|nr:transglycosylase domain-containing protein [Microbacterium invictum]MBB4138441.1 membrane peptidoglycan carboxypeptidase [Microbacterium invictum]
MPHKKRTTTGVLGGLAGLVGLSAVAGVLVTATVTPAIAVSGYAASSAIEVFDNMPSYLEIDKLMLPTEIYVKNADDKDVLLTEFYDQNRIPVAFDEVAPVMYDAILSSEDKNFYSHGGIDLIGTVGALVGNATSGSNRGGSSVTQQYVKNVLQQNCELTANGQEEVNACFEQYSVNEGTAGYQRKLQEMRYAIQLEKKFTKNEILNGYLNIAGFGGVVYGIGAAAEYYFGVNAKDLTIGQAATIAGMVQEPNTYRIDRPDGSTTNKDGELVNSQADGYKLTKNRQVYVLGRMLEDGKITQAEYDEAAAAPIEPNITPRSQGCVEAKGSEFFCEYVVSLIQNDEAFGETPEERSAKLRRGGLKVYTTLDYDLQKAARDAISVVPATMPNIDLGASGVQVEVGTGRVLSMVQNRPYSPNGSEDGSTTAVNYNVRMANGGSIGHSAGSTYKVFSLINWMEQGHSVNEYLNGRVGKKTVETCDGAEQVVPADNSGVPGHIGNFENNNGYTGTIYKFTVDSLNSGFLSMAEKISVCSTNEVAGKLGVTWGDGTPLTDVPAWSDDPTNAPYNVLGSSAVAPIDMAAAYAAIASNGILCAPKAIDKVVDSDGVEQPIPDTKCERVMSEAVASTAAYTLQGVMNGTGVGARTFDGTPVFGKTGIHQYLHTWMDGASTEVATVVWVGNVVGEKELWRYNASGYQLSRIRNSIWPNMQRAANAKYGGDAFPQPDATLTKRTYVTLPSVIGMDEDRAVATLEAAGFDVRVGDPVDGSESEGTIIEQDPGAGRVAGGTTVTIRPSNGKGATVPAVNGTPDDARGQLRSAGFSNIEMKCTETEGAPAQGVVTGTSPAAGTSANRDTAITVEYQSDRCGGRGGNDDG